MSARTMVAVLTLIVSTQISMAQPFPAPSQGSRGTTQDQRDCRPDARRLCREFLGDDMAVLACFQRQRARLSRACRSVLERHGQ
jgi:hypothetical protein